MAEQQARSEPRRRHNHASGPPLPSVAEMELQESQYATVAAPVLAAVDSFVGGWPGIVAPLAALLTWVAGVLLRHRLAPACGASPAQ